MSHQSIPWKRRSVLKALALGALIPRRLPAATPTNPDVVIVGAGAAGLAAAKTLDALGVSYVLLEAATRIGGRCHTDTAIFGVPYDMGAHWMQIRPSNPLIDYGSRNGFDVYRSPDRWKLYVGNRRATGEEKVAAEAAFDEASGAIAAAARKGRDISAREAVGEDFFATPWGPTMAAEIGAWEMAKNLDEFSCVDWWNSAGGQDWFCRQGYGAVLRHYGAGLPAALGTTVESISWGEHGVVVATNKGDIRAKAVIVTVSTGVLAGGHIRFRPDLPPEKPESFDAISMGIYNNVALHFSEDVFGEGNDTYVNNQYRGEESIGFITNISGSNLVFGYVGGRFGASLESDSVQASVDFALAEVKRMLGNDVEKKFNKGTSTLWGKNRLTVGAYASAKPGKAPMRAVLREPVAERIYFAGEACHPTMWATVGGALVSGAETAAATARRVVA